jgi:hypothetical protein
MGTMWVHVVASIVLHVVIDLGLKMSGMGLKEGGS